MPFMEFYQNLKPCSGIFAENGDLKGTRFFLTLVLVFLTMKMLCEDAE